MNVTALNERHWLATLAPAMLLSLAGSAHAAPGTLAQVPLYVGPAVESNIMFLNDDSGSMDIETMGPNAEGTIRGDQPDGSNHGAGEFNHRIGNDEKPCDFPYTYGVFFLSKSNFDKASVDPSCDTAAAESWRFRNSDFNPLYFDPTKTYEPWAGVDFEDIPYTDADIHEAPDNPFRPTETIDLTDKSEIRDGLLMNVDGITDKGTREDSDGFRYYTWNDDGDGVFENGEETEFLIKEQDDATQQNFANWFTYHRSRELVVKYAISKALKDITGVRVGYATINNHGNSGGVKVPIKSMNIDPSKGNKDALFYQLFRTHSDDGTPLRRNLDKIGRYFECVAGNYFDATGADCPILPAAEHGMCQKNFTILLTDGYYNGDAPNPTLGNPDGDNTSAYDGVDLDEDGFNDDGDPYADNLHNTLADVAMHYYERDLAPNLSNDVPASGRDNAPHQHMTTYTVAFGVTGNLDPGNLKTPLDASDSDPSHVDFSWPTDVLPSTPDLSDAAKIDDLWHTAFNGRGDFFSAQNPEELVAAIEAAIVSAAKGTSSASAVAFNTSQLDTGTAVYQALFNPSDNWKGELVATDINIDGTLADNPKWNAGDQLNAQSATGRKIITYKKNLVDPALSAGIRFTTLTDLSDEQQADLNMGPSAADTHGQARLDYLRGDRSNESDGLFFRDRSNVLGDLVHSNPVYVGKTRANYPDVAPYPATSGNRYSEFKTAHANRDGIIYVGANDGMLHGFSEDTGDEVFAYIPNALFSTTANEGLHYLTDPAYAHRYYVDLSPAVADVYINSEWRTLLVGGLGAGGRGLFALDVTDPDTLATAETHAASIVQWEFTNDDDADFGYVTSKATIAKMANGKWAAVVSNGYNSTDGRAMLFIIYLDGGQDGVWTLNTDYFKIDTGVGTTLAPNGLSAPVVIDVTGDELADRVYAGDLMGNLWAFDLSNTSAANWKVAYNEETGKGKNKVQTPKPLFIAKDADTNGNVQPITSRPVIARQQEVGDSITNKPNLMVFFGSGQYLVAGDKTSPNTSSPASHSFYGIWDRGNDSLDRGDLLEQTLDTTHSTADNRVMNNNTIIYGNGNNQHKGWYIDLPTVGERVTVNPIIRGKLLIFATLIPGGDLCLPVGDGWVMVVKPGNGGQPDFIALDVNKDGVIDADDKVNGHSASGFKVDGIPGGLGVIGNLLAVSDDNGNVTLTRMDFGVDDANGRFSWQEIMR